MSTKKGNLLVVGLTGSIGSGKSTVASLLAELGAKVIDADQLAREVVTPGSEALNQIAREFGQEFIAADATLDRTKLGRLVFSDLGKLSKLEDILHPRIHKLFQDRLEQISIATSRLTIVIYDVPLLFESRYRFKEIAKVVVVTAPKEVCIQRVANRTGQSIELIEQRYGAQLPPEQKVPKADFVIINDRSLGDLKEQVKVLYNRLVTECT